MIIAVDFDETIVYSKYPEIHGIRHGVAEALHSLREKGHYVILWTCRCGDMLTEAVNFMLANGIEFDRINDNHPEMVAKYGTNSRKIYADVYIDDRNLGGFPGWQNVVDMINDMED